MAKKLIRLTEGDLHRVIKESVNKILIESRYIQSQKLIDFLNQHGGIKRNSGGFDIRNLNDDDIIDVIDYNKLKEIQNQGSRNYAKRNNIDLDIADILDVIELKDGNYILAKLRGGRYDSIGKAYNDEREKKDGDYEFVAKKKIERERNRYPRKNDYVWNNKDAEEIFHNPYFRHGEGNWNHERKQQVMNNIRNGRKWFENK